MIPAWTLGRAVDHIQSMQALAHAEGYHLALAGGVLNNGYSESDLDIMATPRTADSKPFGLLAMLAHVHKSPPESETPIHNGIVYRYAFNASKRTRFVEVVVLNNGS